MKRYFIIITTLLAIGATAFAQNADTSAPPRYYNHVLRVVEQSSPKAKAIIAASRAEQSSIQAESLFDSPSIEGGYYLGSPSDIGRRWDLSVTQSFDMPSVYHHRSQLRTMNRQQVQLQTAVELSAILHQAQQYCAQSAYYHQLIILLQENAANAQQVADLYAKRLAHGDCNMIEYNRAMMNQQRSSNELALALSESEALRNRLMVLTGGQAFPDIQQFEASSAMDWQQHYLDSSPQQQLMQLQQDISEQEVALSYAERLPHVEVGYASENVVGETFRGATLGITIPLWNNRRKVQAAQIHQAATQSQSELLSYQQSSEADILWKQALSLRQQITSLYSSLQQFDNRGLIVKALQSGEMTLEEYLLNMDYYIELHRQILDQELDLELTMLEIHSTIIRFNEQ